MKDVKLLHKPRWNLVGTDWHMVIGNRSVAKLIPNFDPQLPQYQWLSLIMAEEFEDYWHAVDFTSLDMAKFDLEQWWHYMCLGEAFRPERHCI